MIGTSDWRTRAEDSWRLVGIGLLVIGVFFASLRLRLVILPLLAGAMIAVLAVPSADWLGRHRVPPALAALLAVASLLLSVIVALGAAVAVAVNDFDRIGERLDETMDMVTEWTVDGPFDLTEEEVVEARGQLAEEARTWAREWTESGGAVEGTVTALEMIAGAILAVVVAFFLVKDRRTLGRRMLQRWEEPQRSRVQATAGAVVDSLRGYLKGVVILGAVEGTTIGLAVTVLASPAYGLPLAVFTFVAAFFPVVGAIVAGLLAVVVTLAVAGPVPALVVAVVALLVQQLDNDLLAPVIYGQIIRIHPLGILVAITTGSVLAGVAGAFVAVPLTAMVIAGNRAWEEHRAAEGSPGQAEA